MAGSDFENLRTTRRKLRPEGNGRWIRLLAIKRSGRHEYLVAPSIFYVKNTVMKLEELIRAANSRLTELGLDQLADGRVADRLAPRSVRFLRQAGVISRPEGIGSGAQWGEIHLQQLVTVRALQAAGMSIDAIRDHIQGLDLERLEQLAGEALASWKSPAPDGAEISACSSWQLTPEFILVSTRRTGLPPEKLEQIRRILASVRP
jgi:hypothetical protein